MMRGRAGLSALLGLALGCLLVACGDQAKPPPAAVAPLGAAGARAVGTGAKPQYADELKKLDAAIEHGLALSQRQTADTLVPLEVVSLYLERARLAGDYADYARAESLLATIAAAAPMPSAGICLATARLHFTLHRLKAAADALGRCAVPVDELAVAEMRADIAMYSGRYREAEAIYRSLANSSGTTNQYVRLALLKGKTGAPAEAAALLEAAERRYHAGNASMRAWLKLQRGLVALDRGRLDEAIAIWRQASDELEGWWLIDEHIAEALSHGGKVAEARKLYAAVVERTGAPEFLDALAAIEREQGDADGANRLTARARAIYEQRLEQFPEASAGHALDHFLQDPADRERALKLARANHQARPFGEASISLARALLNTGQPRPALALVESELARGWDTAETFVVLASARKALGQQPAADAALAQALQRNPLSEKMYR